MRLSGEGLASIRGERTVFTGLSFAVEAGKALILNGPNGAGKSTLLRLVAGLLVPDAGSIRLEGGDSERTVGAQCHYVGHQDAIKPALTVQENAAFWSTYLGGVDTDEALAAVGLAHLGGIPAGLLSAGQKRRLGLARLAVAPRPIWLLDEPTVSLDAEAQRNLASLMRGHLAGGGLLIAATHLPLDLEGAATLTLAGSRG